ncbi:MAG TPA: DUF1801 domain-containing protein [Novosphingobium sp.]|nr:DUF1801 domain-containing protein [Novosphingobium sp.]HQA18644.1 DUF1801 domain-containing protein [Novosphingobium sp.]
MTITPEIDAYHSGLAPADQAICSLLRAQIDAALPEAESKVWHGHPVWFLDGNPVAGYSKQKSGIRLMFWSGADFGEPALNVVGKKFKDASIFYTEAAAINRVDLCRWLGKARDIQWDYKNIVKRKGVLERLT